MHAEAYPLGRLQALALGVSGLILFGTAMMTLGPLLAGSSWWWFCVGSAAAVFLSASLFRALRVTPSLVPVLSLVVLVFTVTALFGGSTALLGVIPTQSTFAEFASLFNAGRASIHEQAVPAVADPGILFILALSSGLVAAVIDIQVVTLRVPAFAAIPALIPITATGLIVEDGADIGTLLLVGAAYLVLLRLDVLVRRSSALAHPDTGDRAARILDPPRVTAASAVGATLGLAGVGLLTAAMLSAVVPSVSTSVLFGTGERGGLFTRGVSPLVDLGQDLRRPEAVPALHYTSESGERPYFTLLTLDTLEGKTWTSAPSSFDSANTLEEFPRPPGLDADVQTTSDEIRIFIDGVYTPWLPLPYPTSQVFGVNGPWYWDESTHNVSSPVATTRGQRYRAMFVNVDPSPEQLRLASTAVPVSMNPYLALPDDLPEIIATTAAEQTAGATSPYDAAVRLQQYLRGIDFRYSTDAPVEEGYDGGGLDVVAEFLEKRAGYCVHFASAMAVMARELGIPSRISLGYTAGRATSLEIDGRTRFNVSSNDLHSWPELYFHGVGWLPFEPTPGRGVIPQYSRDSVLDPAAGESIPLEAMAPDDLAALEAAAGGDGGVAIGAEVIRGLVRGGLIGIAALVALLIPALLRYVLRRVRHRAARGGVKAASAAWSELLATGADYSIPALSTETPRRYARRLRELEGFEDEVWVVLDRLVQAVEAERYGQHSAGDDGALDLRHDLNQVCAAIAAGHSMFARFRARMLPTSLLSRRFATRGVSVVHGA